MNADSQMNNIAICVCTYRRPQIIETLHSLAALQVPQGFDVSVLVIDNDNTPSARPLVEQVAETSPIPIRYVHCPAGNISLARNCALDNAAARYLAFIDDDEIATDTWLVNLMHTAKADNCDVVLGPVQAVYAAHAPAWMQKLAIHATKPVWVNGRIETGYSCNVLIDQNGPALAGLRFDLALGQSGGEDSKFFNQVAARAGVIGYAPDALVTEDVPDSRASFKWLLQRRYRMGQTHGQLIAEAQPGAMRLMSSALLRMAKIVYCAAAFVINMISPARRNAAFLRGALHVGVLFGLFGFGSMRLYGAPVVAKANP